MDTKEMTTEIRMQHWANILREQKSSGMSIRAWCEENGVSEKSYYYWQKKLRTTVCEELERSQGANGPTFAMLPALHEVETHQYATQTCMRIRFRNGAEIEIHKDTDARLAESVVRVLAKQC